MKSATSRVNRVSPSMVKSVFGQLKSNGYSNGQIVALSNGLAKMANDLPTEPVNSPNIQKLSFEFDLSQLGL